jgi:hypothetical protein
LALKFSRKERTYIPKWADNDKCDEVDQISLKFTPLTVEDMFAVQKATTANLFGGMELDSKDPESFAQYWSVLRQIIVKFTADWKNIIVDNVEVSDSNSVMDTLGTGEMELLNEVFNHIIEQSSGTKAEEKNSEAEPEVISSDSATTVEVASSTILEEKETALESS